MKEETKTAANEKSGDNVRKRPLFIKGESTDPYFNLALEEYLLRRRSEHFVSVWKNAPAVIVGINQNTAEEVDLDFAERSGIKVVRRQTGGGAVYHDLGNVCYTIIDDYDGNRDNYRFFTQGVIGYLATLGVHAEFSGRNDITVDGAKISGNAQCVYGNRIMHHGTLLFSTDSDILARVLRPHRLKVESKGIKSVRARVTNLCERLAPMTADQFFEGLAAYLSRETEPYALTPADVAAVQTLVSEKYSTFGWNVGTSPKATFRGEKKFPFGLVSVSFDVENGRLGNVSVNGDFFSVKEISGLNLTLNGVLYRRECVENALADVSSYIVGGTPSDIAEIFFM